MKRRTFVGLILFIVLVSDQLTKIWARGHLMGTGRHNYMGSLVSFEYAENPGAFLSVGSGLSDQQRFLIFSVGVIFVLLWASYLLIRRADLHRVEVWGLALLLAGGLGNLIDRLMKSTVTDFVQMGVADLHTGIFNVADVAIMAGVLLLVASSFLTQSRKKPHHHDLAGQK